MNSDFRHKVVISLGSNTQDALHQMQTALEWCEHEFASMRNSAIYSTAPLSGQGSRYLNAVAEGFTSRSFSELNLVIKDYERRSGRDEECRLCGRVPIDIDVVVYDSEIVRPKDFAQSYFSIGYSDLHPEVTD